MQWSNSPSGGVSDAPVEQLYAPVVDSPPYSPAEVNVADQMNDSNSLLNFHKKLIGITKAHQAFGEGDFEWAISENKALAAYFRTYQDDEQPESILVINNLSGESQEDIIPLPEGSATELQDLVSGQVYPVSPGNTLEVRLEPYQYLWLQAVPQTK